MFRTNCLCCKSSNLHEIINLGLHPFADTFIPKDKTSEVEKLYPLILDMCLDCCCVQSKVETTIAERYEDTNYSYTSSNSKTSKGHWNEFALETSKITNLTKKDVVIEIGCNDGYLLQEFIKLGFDSYGIDASPFMAKIASEKATVFKAVFTHEYAKYLGLKAKLVVANNVLNHSNDPLDFVLGIKEILQPDGTFIFEVPYWGSAIESDKFDQIYHEHVTYFTVAFADNLLKKAGFFLNGIDLVNYHGGSLRVFASLKPEKNKYSFLKKLFNDESHLFNLKIYSNWAYEIKQKRNQFLEKIYQKLNNNETIVAIGAAAKGNTFLNYYNLDSSIIKFVTDSSEYKIDKFTPRTRIPIVKDEELSKLEGKVNAIILSWNLSDVIKEKLLKINQNIEFLSP